MIKPHQAGGASEHYMGEKMTEQEERKKQCCFTGHRPEKLNRPEVEIIAWLEAEIRKAIDDGFVTFISGMARGVDIWAAEIVLRLRDDGMPIRLICAVPFEGFEHSLDDGWKQRYTDVMEKADLVKYVCEHYSRACFQICNEWMVDHSARVIAVYNGQSGGTKNTIRYARSYEIEVKIISDTKP